MELYDADKARRLALMQKHYFNQGKEVRDDIDRIMFKVNDAIDIGSCRTEVKVDNTITLGCLEFFKAMNFNILRFANRLDISW